MAIRDQVIRRQLDFFGGRLPTAHDENLFLPLDGEDLTAFREADGKELKWKMRVPHSSSALCVNFFSYWKRNALDSFLKVFSETVFGRTIASEPGSCILFETKHRFGREPNRRIIRGKPGNLDLEVRWTRSDAALFESKFTEHFSTDPAKISEVNRTRYIKVFGDYVTCDPAALLAGGRERKFYQLAQRLLYTIENADPEFSSIPSRRMVFLYYDYEDFDRDLLEFPEIVKPAYRDSVRILSYQALFEETRKRLDGPEHREYFEYMARRYF